MSRQYENPKSACGLLCDDGNKMMIGVRIALLVSLAVAVAATVHWLVKLNLM